MNISFETQQGAWDYARLWGNKCSAPWQAYNGLWYVTFYERSNW
jgi:hypothetical protein